MLSVPRVTMNGGSLIRVTSRPLSVAGQRSPTTTPISSASKPGHAVVGDQLRHHQRRQHHDRADGQVDAGGQDDQGLPDGQRADDRHLLDDQGQVLRPQKSVSARPKTMHGQDQHDQRAERRVPVQDVLDALAEAGGRVRRSSAAMRRRRLGHGGPFDVPCSARRWWSRLPEGRLRPLRRRWVQSDRAASGAVSSPAGLAAVVGGLARDAGDGLGGRRARCRCRRSPCRR